MRTCFAQLLPPAKILLTISWALTLLLATTMAIQLGNMDFSMPSSLKEREGMRPCFQPYEPLSHSRQGLLKSSSRRAGEMREGRLESVRVSVSNGKAPATSGGDNSPSRRPEVVRAAAVNYSAPIGDPHSTTILLGLAATCGALALSYRLAQRVAERAEPPEPIAADALRQDFVVEAGARTEHEMGRLRRTLNVTGGSIRLSGKGVICKERITATGRLSASILHDLRNPVAAISGAAEMLVDADLPPAHVKRLAGNIYRASQRIQEMLQDELNISRGEAEGRNPLVCAK
jgi:signal transduction histidine kinase